MARLKKHRLKAIRNCYSDLEIHNERYIPIHYDTLNELLRMTKEKPCILKIFEKLIEGAF